MKAKDPVRRGTARLRAPDEAPHCLMSDASVFIGLTSIPVAEGKEFIQEMDRLFEKYQDSLSLKGDKPTQSRYRRLFYRPKRFLMFAPYDLAILALTDDYQFGVQAFSPVDPVASARERDFRSLRNPEERNPLAEADKRSFYYRVLLGPCPRFTEKEGVGLGPESYLIRRWQRDIASQNSLPLLGICQVELNSSFSVGAGGTFLRCALKAFRAKFDKMFGGLKRLKPRLIILESFGWQDLTLLVFASSFMDIARYIFAIRNITVAQMGMLIQQTAQSTGRTQRSEWGKDWQQFLDKPTFLDTCLAPGRRLLTPADREKLREPITAGNLRQFEDRSPLGCHVIFNTTSLLGFDADLMVKTPGRLGRVYDRDRVYAFTRWTSRPGHTELAYDALRESCICASKKHRPTRLLLVGRSDMAFPCRLVGGRHRTARPRLRDEQDTDWFALKAMSSRDVVARAVSQHEAVRQRIKERPEQRMLDREELPVGSLTAADTMLGFDPLDIREVAGEPEPRRAPRLGHGHNSVQQCRLARVWGVERVEELYGSLRNLRVPKVTAERVYNAIAQFNEGIQDEFLFSNFIELEPYLKRISETIRWYERSNRQCGVGEVTDTIDELIDAFELGWRNRFHASWRQGDVSDYNLEFKGAIQHIASAFHGAFQNLSWILSQQRRVLAAIGGRSSISIRHGAVSLNVFDVFMPEFFIARAAHEAFETLLGLQASAESGRQRAMADSPIAELLQLGTDTDRTLRRKEQAIRKAIAASRPTRDMKKLLINLLKPRFFNQVLADVCNFNTVFFADPELYSFWWRVVFIADPHSWRADGSVDVSQLSEALLRLMLVLNDGSPVGFQANGVRDVVKRCWQTSLPGRREDEVAMLIRRLPDELDGLMRTWPLLKAWQSEAANYIKESLWIPDATDEDIGDLRSELDVALASGRLNQGQRRMLTDILDCKPLKFRQVLQERVELARDFLEKGRCCVAGMPRRLLGSESLPPSIDRWFDFIDTVVVFHAYLKLLKEQCQDRRGNMLDCLLPLLRKDGSTDQARLHSDPGCLYYNPRGGSFTSDINFRRRYLRWRGALIMSLWDISEQGKLREW